jgi:nicotinate-nucleotide pyrophosphorylase
MNWLIVDEIIRTALIEDMPHGDITTEFIIPLDTSCTIDIIQKEDGLICGVEVFKRVYKIMGEDSDVEFLVSDGEYSDAGEKIGSIKGSSKAILSGERVALNFLQRMSGIATLTRKYVEAAKGYDAKILDTRKTTPGLRILEKHATKTGGATNHRFNLSDGVMIKDNHIKAAGSIKNAVETIRANMPFVRKIEVETESLNDVREALESGVDIIMLDNMDRGKIMEAVGIIKKNALIEVSGNVKLENIQELASTGVDYISVGKLTHSYKSLDISMKNLMYMR